jgi:ABC-type transport system involved in multi-copper enzyme maturation permease subunit
MTQLIRAELLKIRTTNTWWLFGLGAFLTTALAFLVNALQAHQTLHEKFQIPPDIPANEAERMRQQFEAQHHVYQQAANIYTSGQFFGVMFIMLLGMLLITNEYHHQMATATYLTTPHRTTVVMGKLATAIIAAGFLWLATTILDIIAGVIFFKAEGFDPSLGTWSVQRAILLNLVAYALWAVFGVGFGALIRSQIGATVTGTLLYVVGTQLAQGIFFLIYTLWIKKTWVLTSMVIVPAIASQIMVSPNKLYPESPPQWVGAAVLIGYGLVAGAVGTWILRRRDIS